MRSRKKISLSGSVERAELRHEYGVWSCATSATLSSPITKQIERHFVLQIICSRRKLPPIQPHARVVSRPIDTFSTISLYFLKHRIADIRQNSSAFLLPLASVKGFNTFLLLNWIIAVLYSSRSIHTKWQTISVIATFQTPIQFRFSNRTLATKIITKTEF